MKSDHRQEYIFSRTIFESALIFDKWSTLDCQSDLLAVVSYTSLLDTQEAMSIHDNLTRLSSGSEETLRLNLIHESRTLTNKGYRPSSPHQGVNIDLRGGKTVKY